MIKSATIGQIAAVLPQALDYFNDLGIDYCCGGNRKLLDVLKEKRLNEDAVINELIKLEEQAKSLTVTKNFLHMSSYDLCDYIVNVHHAYLYKTLPEISEIIPAVMRAHGEHHPELFEVGTLFGTLRGDLEQHLIKEELFLFPALKQLTGEDKIISLSTDIISEHEGAGEILHKLEDITNDFKPPSDACKTYIKLYGLLSEMNNDIHRHIHLENNILLREYDNR